MKQFKTLTKELKRLEDFHKKVIEDQTKGVPTKPLTFPVVEEDGTLHMKTFKELNEDAEIALLESYFLQLDERSGLNLGDLLPKKVLHLMKRVMHKKAYIEALKIAKTIVDDPRRNVSRSQALISAAQIVGLDPKEFRKVLDKNTRNK